MVVALGGSLTGTAAASTWTGHQLGGEAAKARMFGISCPSASLCVAVGANNTIASSSDPGSGNWNAVYAGEGASPTASNFRQVRSVSCPTTGLCVAVSYEGLIYTATDPTGPAGAWSVTDLESAGPSTHLYGVSCPTPSFCVAVAGQGKILTSTSPTGGASAWSITQLPPPLEARGVSCLSASFCVAVGDGGERANPTSDANGEVLSSTNPLGGVWQRVGMSGAGGPLYGVTCPAVALCVSGNLLGDLLVSTNPTGPATAWPVTDGGGAVQITAASCPSVSRCVAADNNGDLLTSTDPTAGAGAWTFTNLIPFPPPGVEGAPANGLFGISCSSVSFCAIAATEGRILTSSDPFVAPPPTPKTSGKDGNGKRRHRKVGPKRPRTKIARAPLAGIETRSKKVRARTFFYPRHHVHVSGFLCRLDGGAPKRCRSPKSYLVGLGRHVVRIRAIGRTGLQGPAAVARFKVCRPHSSGFCLGTPIARTRGRGGGERQDSDLRPPA